MGWMVLLLLLQAACAAIGLLALLRRVMPAVARAGGAGSSVFADVWVPLAIVLPLVVSAGRVGPGVRGAGWLALGAPACVGLAGVGASLLWAAGGAAGGGGASAGGAGAGGQRRLLAVTAGAGLLLVLLGGADELTVWTGQCAFAVAAVLLWMNTPSAGGPDAAAATGPGVNLAMLLALACAGGQSVAGMLVSGRWAAGSAVIATFYAGTAAVGAARAGAAGGAGGGAAGGGVAAGGAGIRVAGWTAALGTFLGIGALSLVHLMPQSLRLAFGLEVTVDPRVAYGFGAFAFEGMILLLLLPAGMWAGPRLGRTPRRRVGFIILLLAAGVAAWRLIRIFEEGPGP